MTTVPLRCGSTIFLYVQNGLLSKKDQKLPLARHIVGTLKHFYFIEDFIACMLMWTQEVIVSDPECQIIVGTVDVVEPICMAVRGFISTVQSFNHLFEWTMFCRNSIVVGKSNDLSDGKSEIFAEFLCEFHSGKGISTVSVSNKFKVFRKLFEILEAIRIARMQGPTPRLSDT